MKRKIFLGLFLGLFLLISLTLSVGMLAFGQSQAGANEMLSSPPKWTDKDGGWNESYLSDLADWINDRFFLRQELISLDNLLTAEVFGNSGEDKVLLGKNGWLFFTETLKDYTGTDPLTERERFSAAKNIQLMSLYCHYEGKDFAFLIAPNKNSVYGRYMPDFGVKAQASDAQKLMQTLSALGVKTVDLFTALKNTGEPLYFAHDSHWNSRGAALGADLINRAFGVESSYYAGDFSQKQPHSGDLFAMTYPALTDPEQDAVYGGKLDFTFTGKGTKPDSITIQTAGAGEGKLLAYRDSFGNLLFPYLADSYAQAHFSRSGSYDMTLEADFVLVEIVERNLRNLIKNVPVMPSPVAQVEIPSASAGSIRAVRQEKAKAPQNRVLVQGVLPQAADTASPVYVVCDGVAYEAFLLERDGFAVYVPENGQLQSIVYTAGNAPVKYDIQ